MDENTNLQEIINKFTKILASAKISYEKLGLENYNSCILSTSLNNVPSSRTVLLKEHSLDGFVFYTNFNSRKSQEIAINNKVSLLFHFITLKQQIRIEGTVTKLDESVSNQYFHSRPYSSKIGAWASRQSEIMSSSLDLPSAVLKYSVKYPINVPKPEHWGGFIIVPHYFEFWKEKPFRLHKRLAYKKTLNNLWTTNLLYP
jgi:pyridoxamine 5'-phosphate oxidase